MGLLAATLLCAQLVKSADTCPACLQRQRGLQRRTEPPEVAASPEAMVGRRIGAGGQSSRLLAFAAVRWDWPCFELRSNVPAQKEQRLLCLSNWHGRP